jgi:alpha-mannosidase
VPQDAIDRSWRFHIVPHTHWDREWYRPFEHFRLELARVVDQVLDTLEQDPAFTSFTLDGQAIVLEDYLDARPENEGRLRALIAAGRIEVGPSYVLPDEFLVGAEPLVRNLLHGRAVCERFGATASPVGYMPDSFGHPLQLPQILAGFGIGTFIFTRGLGDQLDDAGVVFRWRAPDGSEVLAFQQLSHYGNFAAIEDVGDGERRIRKVVERFGPALERAGVRDVLLCNGTDHLPIQPQMPAWCVELERRLPGMTVGIGQYADYVRAVGTPEVPSVEGELLGSRVHNVLRGVNSARMYIKQANERAEQSLLAAETFAALRTLHDGTPFPGSDFTLAWRELLRCHPHDTICGCSCDEVHRDALARYDSLERGLAVLRARALDGIATDAGEREVTVINLLPEARRGVVEADGCEPALVEFEAFSSRTVTLAERADPALVPEPLADGGSSAGAARPAIDNGRVRIEAAGDGTLTVIGTAGGCRLAGVHALEDEPDMGDLYNFCPVQEVPAWHAGPCTARVLRDGPVVWELELRVDGGMPAGLDEQWRPLAQAVPLSVVTIVRLERGSGRVEFTTTVENAARNHRLRVVFPAGATGDEVRAEGQFAVVHRPLHPEPPRTGWVEPPDATQHTCGAVALGQLALIGKGLPEYEARVAGNGCGELCLTLLRAIGTISRPSGAIATRPLGAGPDLATPEGQCLGTQRLEYALLPGGGALDDVALLRASQDYRAGLLAFASRAELAPALRLEGEVVFSCLKGSQDGDGLVLRCFNPAASAAAARVTGQVDVARTRLDETGPEQPLPDGRFDLGAGEIATLRLRRR